MGDMTWFQKYLISINSYVTVEEIYAFYKHSQIDFRDAEGKIIKLYNKMPSEQFLICFIEMVPVDKQALLYCHFFIDFLGENN